jgi:predicted aldo/keto reductase-like oxidoreductase
LNIGDGEDDHLSQGFYGWPLVVTAEKTMQYRRFGQLDWQVSALGFGAMRLPILDDDFGKINEPEATMMIRYAIDHGVNYIDTAYAYHRGTSEALLGRALQDGYRQKVRIATKMPTWLVHSQEDMEKYLEEQLSRLKTDKIDFYLLHGMNRERWANLTKLKVFQWAEEKMAEAKFSHLGFSFHDEYPLFKKMIDSYDNWTLCQVLYNYMDAKYQAGTRGIRYAASKGLAVVVMEPIAGGRLALKSHTAIDAIWNEADVKRSPAEWALLWVWNNPDVTVVLSGMSSPAQVKENISTADNAQPGILSKKELSLFLRVAREYKKHGFIQCTNCRYCQPCPSGVDIPTIIALFNEFYMKNRDPSVKAKYQKEIPSSNNARRCTRCGKCEELCPQHLPIKNTMNRAAFLFEQA